MRNESRRAGTDVLLQNYQFWESLADEEGFEPPEPLGSTVFKTAAIDHSATHPVRGDMK